MPGRLEFDLTFNGGQRNQRPRDRSDPLRILVVGDFAGRRERTQGLADRCIHSVDVDDFDPVLARIAPVVAIPVGSSGEQETLVEFDSLESFHPDALYRRLDVFAALRDLRRRLRDPASFEQATREMLASGAVAPTESGEDSDESAVESAGDLTERLLGARSDVSRSNLPAGRIDALIRRLIEPHLERDSTAGAAPYIAAVDEAATVTLRVVLGADQFKRLEASWRGLRSLVDQLELGESTTLAVLDASRDELVADLETGAPAIDSTRLHRRLVDGLEDARPGVIILDYEFGAASDDLRLLAALGAIGASIGASVIGAAAASLVGATTLATQADPRSWAPPGGEAGTLWQTLRNSAVAASIGLALPRILLRQPYGAANDAIDSFEFEELADPSAHEAYLWGNPAYACALLIAQAFAANGWDMVPGSVLDIDDLPACVFSSDTGRTLKPCAEILLTERAVDQLLAAGLMPFVSHRNRNSCRLARFQSIAEPACPLSGPWSA